MAEEKFDFKTKEVVLQYVKEKGVTVVQLWFVDILGEPKSFSIPVRELKEAIEEGKGFDGSSVEGFARIHESDLIVKPDISTFRLVPWSNNGDVIARMICDIENPDGTPYAGDSRRVLKRALKIAKEHGYDNFYVGPELEYYYFAKTETQTEIPVPLDSGGYFDLVPDKIGDMLRRKTTRALEKMGILIEYDHHEVGPSQHEIDIKYTDALKMADFAITYRIVVKKIAEENGYYATFMPKPLAKVNGSGMHVHQSLFRNKRNVFFDKNDKYNLSPMAKSYMAGLLKYTPEMVSITSQWVNSFKRIIPGFEAPAYISWGQKNRSALVRIPRYKLGHENSTRIEFRCPDPACNPYLVFSVMLMAGLQGIKEKLSLQQPIEDDIYTMSETERKKNNIKSLPADLHQAIIITEKSELVRKTLGDHIFEKFIENKKAEWAKFTRNVTDYELKQYLPIL